MSNMPVTPPALADPIALSRQRARVSDGGFLHALARAELYDRLSEVNRTFTRPALVTGLPQVWGDLLPGARVVQDAPVLDLEAGAHDLVVHAMALHWAADPVGQLIQARRALVPDGLLLAVFPGGQTLAELRACLAQAEAELSGGLSPRILPMTDLRDAGALLQRAGFALPVADSVVQNVAYGDLSRLFADLREMGERNALAARRRIPAKRALFDHTRLLYAQHFCDLQGRLLARYELLFLTGWAPAATQPQPLRPGSAHARLADALGTAEFSAQERPPNGCK
jgi:SAM-dependent methyltransferase